MADSLLSRSYRAFAKERRRSHKIMKVPLFIDLFDEMNLLKTSVSYKYKKRSRLHRVPHRPAHVAVG